MRAFGFRITSLLLISAAAAQSAVGQDVHSTCEVPPINVVVSPKRMIVHKGECCDQEKRCCGLFGFRKHCHEGKHKKDAAQGTTVTAASVMPLMLTPTTLPTAVQQHVVQQSSTLDQVLASAHQVETAMVNLKASMAAADAANAASKAILDRVRNMFPGGGAPGSGFEERLKGIEGQLNSINTRLSTIETATSDVGQVKQLVTLHDEVLRDLESRPSGVAPDGDGRSISELKAALSDIAKMVTAHDEVLRDIASRNTPGAPRPTNGGPDRPITGDRPPHP